MEDATLSEPPPPLPRPHQNGRRRLGRHHHHQHHHHSSLSLSPARPVLSRETVTGGWGNGEARVKRRALPEAQSRLGDVVPLETPRLPRGGASLSSTRESASGAALRLPIQSSPPFFNRSPRELKQFVRYFQQVSSRVWASGFPTAVRLHSCFVLHKGVIPDSCQAPICHLLANFLG